MRKIPLLFFEEVSSLLNFSFFVGVELFLLGSKMVVEHFVFDKCVRCAITLCHPFFFFSPSSDLLHYALCKGRFLLFY